MVLSEGEATTKHEKHNAHNKQDNKKEKPSTKVVIRRLPPSMTQDEFINQVSPIPEHDYIYTIKGDYSLGENAFARAYVNFSNQEDLYVFKEKFDNYVFVDGKGHEYAAVVEYAAFQKVPKRKRPRPDPKSATIESDPAYIEFLESLIEQPNLEEKPEYSYNISQLSNENKHDITTPLLDYLKQRKVERMRQREEKREERRKKDQERKKMRDEDRKKRLDEKKQKNSAHKEAKKDIKERDKDKDKDEVLAKEQPGQAVKDTVESPATEAAKPARTEKGKAGEKSTEKSFKNRNKFEEKKQKQKFKFEERDRERDRNKEFKSRRDEFRERERENYARKFDDKKQEPKEASKEQKKVKKYSEKREERKIVEASKEEAKRAEAGKKVDRVEKEPKKQEQQDARARDAYRSDDDEYDGRDGRSRNKENDPRAQRRIRNKDRPTMQLYKPGMLRKKSVDNDKDECCFEKGEDIKDDEKQECKDECQLEDPKSGEE